MLLMMWVESSRCFPVRIPSAWMIRSVVSWKASRPPSCCIRRTRKLCSVFWGRWVSSISSRRAWCQSRLNSSCSRASSSVRLNISLRRWTPRTVCTARLGRPLSAQYIGAKRSSSIRGSASFRKTSAQLRSKRLAFFGGTRNSDCHRLTCGSRSRKHAHLPRPGAAPRRFPTLSLPCPSLARGFYERIMLDDTGTETTRSDAPSVDDSLFGDAADDAVAEEQDANEETAQDPQDADDAGEQAGSPEDLKVVVSIKGGTATIGVQRPSPGTSSSTGRRSARPPPSSDRPPGPGRHPLPASGRRQSAPPCTGTSSWNDPPSTCVIIPQN